MILLVVAVAGLMYGCGGDKYDKLNLSGTYLSEGNATKIESNTTLVLYYDPNTPSSQEISIELSGIKNINYSVNIVPVNSGVVVVRNQTLSGKTTTATLVAIAPGKTEVKVSSVEYSDKALTFTVYVINKLDALSLNYKTNEKTLAYSTGIDVNLLDYIDIKALHNAYGASIHVDFELASGSASAINMARLRQGYLTSGVNPTGVTIKAVPYYINEWDKHVADNSYIPTPIGDDKILTFNVAYVAPVEKSNIKLTCSDIKDGKLQLLPGNRTYSASTIKVEALKGSISLGTAKLIDSSDLDTNPYFMIAKVDSTTYEVRSLAEAGFGNLGVEVVITKANTLDIANIGGLVFAFDDLVEVEAIGLPTSLIAYINNQSIGEGSDYVIYNEYFNGKGTTLSFSYNSYYTMTNDNKKVMLKIVNGTNANDIDSYNKFIFTDTSTNVRLLNSSKGTGTSTEYWYEFDANKQYTLSLNNLSTGEYSFNFSTIYNNLPQQVTDASSLITTLDFNVKCQTGVSSFELNIGNTDGIIRTIASQSPRNVEYTVTSGSDPSAFTINNPNEDIARVSIGAVVGTKGSLDIIGLKEGIAVITLESGNGYKKVITIQVLGKNFEGFSLDSDTPDIDYNITEKIYANNGELARVNVKKNNNGISLYAKADTYFSEELVSVTSSNSNIVSVEVNASATQDLTKNAIKRFRLNTKREGQVTITVTTRFNEYRENAGKIEVTPKTIIKTVELFVFEPIQTLSIYPEEKVVYSYDSLGADNISLSKFGISLDINNGTTQATITKYPQNIVYTIISGSITNGTGIAFDNTVQDNGKQNGFYDNNVCGMQAYLQAYNATHQTRQAIVMISIDEFGLKTTKYCLVTIINATLTESVKVENSTLTDENDNDILDVRKGNIIDIETSYLPSTGVTFGGVEYFVKTAADEYTRLGSMPVVNGLDGNIQLLANGRICGVTAGSGYVLAIAKDSITNIEGNVINLADNPRAVYRIIKVNVTDGTINNPYVIKSSSDLKNVGEKVKDSAGTIDPRTVYFVLGNNIDMSNETNWTPIVDENGATFSNVLNGYYSGKLFSINGFRYSTNNLNGNKFGLFGDIASEGMLLNLTLNATTIAIEDITNTETNIGILAASNAGLIQNCSVNFDMMSVSKTNALNVGSIVGVNTGNIYNFARKGTGTVEEDIKDQYLKTYAGYQDVYDGADKLALSLDDIANTLSCSTALNVVKGTIQIINSDGTVPSNVGGLVGNNEGNIYGVYGLYYNKEITPSVGAQETKYNVVYESQGVDVSVNIANISSSKVYGNVGGITGSSTGSIYGVSSEGRIGYAQIATNNTNYAIEGNLGGIVGDLDSKLIYAQSNVYLAGSGNVGGVVGHAKSATISYVRAESYYVSKQLANNASLIRAEGNIGGLVGDVGSEASESTSLLYSWIKGYTSKTFYTYSSQSTMAYYFGEIWTHYPSSDTKIGSLIGNGTGAEINQCFADIRIQRSGNENGSLVTFAQTVNVKNSYEIVSTIGIDCDDTEVDPSCYYVHNNIEGEFILNLPGTWDTTVWDTTVNTASNKGYPVLWLDKGHNIPLLNIIPQTYNVTPTGDAGSVSIISNGIGYNVSGISGTQTSTSSVVDMVLFYANGGDNRYLINNILNTNYSPSTLKLIRVICATDNNIAHVDNNGYLIVEGIGEFTLDLTPLLNQALAKSVDIKVLDFVDSFKIFETSNTSNKALNYEPLQVRRGDEIQLYPYAFNNGIQIDGSFVVEYIADISCSISNNILTVAQNATEGEHNISAKLYYTYNGLKIPVQSNSFTFKANVVIGAKDITVSAVDMVMSASETPSITATLDTDITDDEVILEITALNGLPKKSTIADYTIAEIFDVELIKRIDLSKQATFVIKVVDNEVLRLAIDKEYAFTFKFIADSNREKFKEVTVRLIPQVLRSLDMYYYTFEGIERVVDKDYDFSYLYKQNNTFTVGPGSSSLIEISAFPSYSDVKNVRIESSSVDNKALSFEQVLKSEVTESGELKNKFVQYSGYQTSGLLVLDKASIYDNVTNLASYNGKLYVRVIVPSDIYEGASYTIKAFAVRNDGSDVEIISSINVQVQEVPSVDIKLSRDKIVYIKDSDFRDSISLSVETSKTVDLSSVEYSLESTDGTDIDYAYIVDNKVVLYDTAIVGTTFVVEAKLRVIIDGIEYANVVKKQITIVDYVINSVSVLNINDDSIMSLMVSNAIRLQVRIDGIGDLARKTELENSISRQLFNNSIANWKVVSGDVAKSVDDSSLRLPFTVVKSYINDRSAVISIVGKSAGMSSVNMRMQYDYYYNDDGKLMIGDAPEEDIDEYISKPTDFVVVVYIDATDDNPLPITTEEELRAMTASSDETKKASYILLNDITISNHTPLDVAIDSLDGNNKVITIENFNFDSTETGTVNLGLFSTVAENTIIKNLTVALPSNKQLATQLTNFTTINYGGIAGINNGIITNCDVISTYDVDSAMSSSSDLSCYYAINIATATVIDGTYVTANVGGLVGQNNNIITNSRVGNDNLQIVESSGGVLKGESTFKGNYDKFLMRVSGPVNLGGFASVNGEGAKISNSYAKNVQLEAVNGFSTNQMVGGFVAFNAGEIIGSYSAGWEEENAPISKTDNSVAYYKDSIDGVNYNRRMGGGIFANYSGGFVYENSGNISDSYSSLNMSGAKSYNSSDTHAAGFVYHNTKTGIIETSYSNSMVKKNQIHGPFTGIDATSNQVYNEGTINKCYYLLEKGQVLFRDLEVATAIDQELPQDLSSIADTIADIGELLGMNNFIEYQNFGGFSFDSSESMRSYTEGMSCSAIWAIKTTNNTSSQKVNNEELRGGYGYPELIAANNIATSVREVASVSDGVYSYVYVDGFAKGSANNPVLIDNAQQFNDLFAEYYKALQNSSIEFSAKYNGNIRIVNNIDFGQLDTIASSSFVYTSTNAEQSILEGNNLSFSNINLSTESEYDAYGLFSALYKVGVKNLNIEIDNISARNTKAVGGLAGVIADSDINNIEIVADNQDTKILGQNYVGALAGIIVSSKVVPVTRDGEDGLVSSGTHYINNISVNVPVHATFTQVENISEIGVIKPYDIWSQIIPPSVSGLNANDTNLKLANLRNDVSYAGGIAGIIDLTQDYIDETKIADVEFETDDKAISIVNAKALQAGSYAGQTILFNAQAENAGGLFGMIGTQTYVRDASFYASATSNAAKNYLYATLSAGGIAAFNYGRIDQTIVSHQLDVQDTIDSSIASFVSGTLTNVTLGNETLFSAGSARYIGGLVGINAGDDNYSDSGTISNAYNRVAVRNTRSMYAGGIVGLAHITYLDKVYSTAGLLTSEQIGGVVGKIVESDESRYSLSARETDGLSEQFNVQLNTVNAIPFFNPADFEALKRIKDNIYGFVGYSTGTSDVDINIDSLCYSFESIYKLYTAAGIANSENIIFINNIDRVNEPLDASQISELMALPEGEKSTVQGILFNKSNWPAAMWKQTLTRALPILTYGYIPKIVLIYNVDEFVNNITKNASSDTIYFIMNDIDMGLMSSDKYSVKNNFKGNIYGFPVQEGDDVRNPILFNITSKTSLFNSMTNASVQGVDFQFAAYEGTTTDVRGGLFASSATRTSFSDVNIFTSFEDIITEHDSLTLHTNMLDSTVSCEKFDTAHNLIHTLITGIGSFDTFNMYTLDADDTQVPTGVGYKSYYLQFDSGTEGYTYNIGELSNGIRSNAPVFGAFIAEVTSCTTNNITLMLNLDITPTSTINTSMSIGGIFGSARGTFTDINLIGNITVDAVNDHQDKWQGAYIGGLIGSLRGTLSDSSYNGNIEVKNLNSRRNSANIGGIVGDVDRWEIMGRLQPSSLTKVDCVGDMTVQCMSSMNLGGIAGRCRVHSSELSHGGDITSTTCYIADASSESVSKVLTLGGIYGTYLYTSTSNTIENMRSIGDIRANVSGKNSFDSSYSYTHEFYIAGGIGKSTGTLRVSNAYIDGNIAIDNTPIRVAEGFYADTYSESVINLYSGLFGGSIENELLLGDVYCFGDILAYNASNSNAYIGGMTGVLQTYDTEYKLLTNNNPIVVISNMYVSKLNEDSGNNYLAGFATSIKKESSGTTVLKSLCSTYITGSSKIYALSTLFYDGIATSTNTYISETINGGKSSGEVLYNESSWLSSTNGAGKNISLSDAVSGLIGIFNASSMLTTTDLDTNMQRDFVRTDLGTNMQRDFARTDSAFEAKIDGTSKLSPIKINGANVTALEFAPGHYYSLTNDIAIESDISGYVGNAKHNGWTLYANGYSLEAKTGNTYYNLLDYVGNDYPGLLTKVEEVITSNKPATIVGLIVGQEDREYARQNAFLVSINNGLLYGCGAKGVLRNNGYSANIGGLVNANGGTMLKCFSAVEIINNTEYLGATNSGYEGTPVEGTTNSGYTYHTIRDNYPVAGWYITNHINIAGFVYDNQALGNIVDCYVNARLEGYNVAGFAWSNAGAIKNCYTTSRIVNKAANQNGLYYDIAEGTGSLIDMLYNKYYISITNTNAGKGRGCNIYEENNVFVSNARVDWNGVEDANRLSYNDGYRVLKLADLFIGTNNGIRYYEMLYCGDGSEDDSYQIASADMLEYYLAKNANTYTYYKVINDLDFSAYKADASGDNTWYGANSILKTKETNRIKYTYFVGSFDGDGHTFHDLHDASSGIFVTVQDDVDCSLSLIKGIVFDDCTGNTAGLLGNTLISGNVENITVTNSSIYRGYMVSGNKYVAGMLFAEQTGGNIKGANIENTCSVTATGNAGGVVGQMTNGTINNAYVKTTDIELASNKTYYTRSENYTIVGNKVLINIGLYYEMNAGVYTKTNDTTFDHDKVYYIQSEGTYTSVSAPMISNIRSYYELKNTNASGAVTATTSAGGIVGEMQNGTINGTITNSGAISASSNAGGIVGLMTAGTITGSATAKTTNSGAVVATDNAGGIVGQMQGGAITGAVVNNGAVTANTNAGGIVGFMTNGSVTGGYNKTSDDAIVSGKAYYTEVYTRVASPNATDIGTYYELNLINSGAVTATDNVGGIVGQMTHGSVENVSTFNTETITITSNKYAGGIVGFMNRDKDTECKISGEVDANIDPYTGNNSGTFAGGIVGYMKNSTIVGNNTYSIVNNTMPNNAYCIGGIVGFAENSTISYVWNKNSYGSSVKRDNYGGIVGSMKSGNVEHSKNTGDFSISAESVTNVGGIVGHMEDGTITSCESTGDITIIGGTIANAGGIVGHMEDGTITGTATAKTTNSGAIVANNNAGGIVGLMADGKIETNVANTGEVSTAGNATSYSYIREQQITETSINNQYEEMKKDDKENLYSTNYLYSNTNLYRLTELSKNGISYNIGDDSGYIWIIGDAAYLTGHNATTTGTFVPTANDTLINGTRYYLNTTSNKIVYADTSQYDTYTISGNTTLGTNNVFGFSSTSIYYYYGSKVYSATMVTKSGEYYRDTGSSSVFNIVRDNNHGDKQYAGGIVGYSVKGTISGTNNNTVTATTNAGGIAGGIAGYLGSEATITDAKNDTNGIISARTLAGGIVGELHGAVSGTDTGTINSASVSTTGSYGIAGGIAGQMTSGSITDNVTNVGSVTGKTYAGGIVGHMESGEIKSVNTTNNITNSGSVYAENGAGGIVGLLSSGDIANSVNNGSIGVNESHKATNAGGIVGIMNDGTIASSMSTEDATVTATTNAGGIVGLMNGTATITSSTNKGTITATTNAGGIVGQMSYFTKTSDTRVGTKTYYVYNSGTFEKVASPVANGLGTYYVSNISTDLKIEGQMTNSGTVTANTNAGGIVGFMTNGSVTGGYNKTSDTAIVSGKAYYTRSGEVYTRVASPNVTNKGTYYELNLINSGAVTATDNAGGIVGQMTHGSVANVSTFNTETIKITSNKYAGGIVGFMNKNDGDDGTECKISGNVNSGLFVLTNVGPDAYVGGITGYMKNATIEGTLVSNIYSISVPATLGLSNAHHVGGIVGGMESGTINTVESKKNFGNNATREVYGGIVGKMISGGVINSKNTGNITNPGSGTITNAGGVVGVMNAGTITSCTNAGSVGGPKTINAGGIIGQMTGGNIEGTTSNSGTVTAVTNAGGIVGQMTGGSVGSCTNSNTVTATTNAGGTVGQMTGGSVDNCINNNTITAATNAGGVVGLMSGGTITSCTNGNTVTASTNAGGIVGQMTAGTITCTTSSKTINNGQVGYSATDNAGGIVGLMSAGEITGTISNGSLVTAEINAGGIVGNMDGGNVTESNSIGLDLNTAATIGGIVGHMSGTSAISGCVFGESGADFTSGARTYLGGIIGLMSSGTITNCTNNVKFSASGKVDYLGGIVGYMESGTIESDCKNNGSIIGYITYAGGVVGGMEGGSINGVYCFSNVGSANTTDAGGIAGRLSSGTISTSSYSGKVVAATNAGGITSEAKGGTITSCSVLGTIGLNDYNTDNAGGIAGIVSGAAIESCTVLGINVYASTNGGGIAGKMTSGTISGSEVNMNRDTEPKISVIEYSTEYTPSNNEYSIKVYNTSCAGGAVGLLSGGTVGVTKINSVQVECKRSSDSPAGTNITMRNRIYAAGGQIGCRTGGTNNCLAVSGHYEVIVEGDSFTVYHTSSYTYQAYISNIEAFGIYYKGRSRIGAAITSARQYKSSTIGMENENISTKEFVRYDNCKVSIYKLDNVVAEYCIADDKKWYRKENFFQKDKLDGNQNIPETYTPYTFNQIMGVS